MTDAKDFNRIRMQAVADGVDEVAVAMERKWGVDRLRRLVSDDLRERFDRQARKWNEALFNYNLPEIEKHGTAMRKGWQMLDRVAEQSGAKALDPHVWEAVSPSGKVIALVPDEAHARAAAETSNGRWVEVWTIQEIARLIEQEPWSVVGKVKEAFPGAIVTDFRQKELFDDEIPF